jgi:hypothetical protein
MIVSSVILPSPARHAKKPARNLRTGSIFPKFIRAAAPDPHPEPPDSQFFSVPRQCHISVTLSSSFLLSGYNQPLLPKLDDEEEEDELLLEKLLLKLKLALLLELELLLELLLELELLL